jgi:hypothetical protein
MEYTWLRTLPDLHRGVAALSCVCLVQLTGDRSTSHGEGRPLSMEQAGGQLSACPAVTARL